MKIINLTKKSDIYTSNVYLITGSSNGIEDVNTLVDVGRDKSIIERINNASTGVGKKRIEQVVITHYHFDHSELLPLIKDIYNPIVYDYHVYSRNIKRTISGGNTIKMGDRIFEVLHIPIHSQDSICLYNKEEGILFSGDNNIKFNYNANEEIPSLFKFFFSKKINAIYPGHGDVLINPKLNNNLTEN